MAFIATARRALLLLALFIASSCAGAATPRYEFEALGYYEFGLYVREAATPGAACDAYASIWGWNRNGYTVQLLQWSGGEWACQKYYNGVIQPTSYTRIRGLCQTSKATPLTWLTGRRVYAAAWDLNKGVCYCDSGYTFNRDIEYCEWNPTPNTISLSGADRTKALVAGPALAQVATVMNGSSPVSGVSVSIAISSGTSVAGMTDASGRFSFTYVPPAKATVDHLKAACSSCSNTAEKDITVDPCDVCGPTVGNPIQPATGEKQQREVDWLDAAPHPLTLVRGYGSFAAGDPRWGLWSLPWTATVSAGEYVAFVQLGDGTRSRFGRVSSGYPWIGDGNVDTLVAVPGGFEYRHASDPRVYVFDAAGRLARIVENNGWTMATQRDTEGKLLSVSNAFGRSLSFAYGANGKIAVITAPDGSRISYGYDAAGRLAAVTYPDGTTRSYVYENAQYPNALTGIVDQRGIRVATFGYDAQGLAVSTQHAGAQSFSIAYARTVSARGQLVSGTQVDSSYFRTQATVSDPVGGARTYEWVGGAGQVIMSGASGQGGIASFASRAISDSGLAAQETDFAGASTTSTWDEARRLKTQRTEAAGRPEARSTSTEWHPAFPLPVRVTEQGRVTEYSYDTLGNKLSETVRDTATGQAPTRTWTYTPRSLVSSETDAAGNVWRYGYDAVGNRTSVTDPMGRTSTYAFDGAGRVTSQQDGSGLTSTFVYDARGRLVTQTRGGEATGFAYTATGQVARATLPNGYEVRYAYDAADRLVSVSDNLGASVSYTLDGAGNRIREEVKDVNGNVALAMGRVIDSLNRVAATQGALGQTTQYGYDANGEPVSSTDPLNQTTRETLDALRRNVATTFPDNASAQQEWNALDSVTQVTDPKGIRTQYGTNAFGEVTSETSPDVGTTTYERDAAGNVIATTDARGKTARITRDALGRPTEIRYDDQQQLFTYDANGNVVRIEDGSGSTVYTRDALGRVLTKTQTVNDVQSSPSQYAVQYGYANGDLSSVKYPSGLLVTYRRAAGRITQVDVLAPGKNKSTVAFATSLAYTALGQPSAWTWFNGDSASRSFDSDGRMTANEFARYGWDAASRITSITQNLWVNTGTALAQTPITWSVGYDSRNRITNMSRAGQSTTFTYDANSNRLSRMEIASGEVDLEAQFDAPGMSLTTSETPKVDAGSNRLVGFSIFSTFAGGGQSSSVSNDVNYTVDAAGNMTSDGLRTFVYDASNRLAKVQATRGGDSMDIEYLHNALGQRVFKSDALVQSTESGDGKFTSGFIGWLKSNFGWMFSPGKLPTSRTGLGFVYDEGGNLLAAYGNGSNQAAQQEVEYIWLPLEHGTSIPIGAYKGGQFYAVHADHLGTPRLMTDAANKPAWQWPYSAFGANKPSGVLKTVTTTTSSTTQLKATAPAVESNLRFPGQYWDSESYLAYNYFRLYCPECGRYTQFDPMGLTAGLNGFIYVGADTLRKIDPAGLAAEGAAIGGFIGGAVGARFGGAAGARVGSSLGSRIGSALQDVCRQGPDCDELNRRVQEAKARTGQLGGCRATMSRVDLLDRKQAWLAEASARARRDMVCWEGGDEGHQDAQARAWSNVGTCSRLLQ